MNRPVVRLLLLGALIAGLIGAGRLSGAAAWLTTDHLRGSAAAAGWWGVLLFIAAFSVAELLHVPGLLFAGAAGLVYGRLPGALVAWVGSIIAISLAFVVVRGVGGQALTRIRRPFVQRMLAHLDRRPIATIFVLRLLMALSSPLSYTLALSSVRYRDYLLGSAAGLIIPVTLMSFFSDWLSRHF